MLILNVIKDLRKQEDLILIIKEDVQIGVQKIVKLYAQTVTIINMSKQIERIQLDKEKRNKKEKDPIYLLQEKKYGMGLLNSPISSTRFATVTFFECELRGLWEKLSDDFNPIVSLEAGWGYYRVQHKDGQELWLVRPDGLRRAWVFRNAAIVKLGPNSIQFDHEFGGSGKLRSPT